MYNFAHCQMEFRLLFPLPLASSRRKKGARIWAPLGRPLYRWLNLNVVCQIAGVQFYGTGTAAMLEGALVTPEPSTLSTI
jgi:hypothetical protein